MVADDISILVDSRKGPEESVRAELEIPKVLFNKKYANLCISSYCKQYTSIISLNPYKDYEVPTLINLCTSSPSLNPQVTHSDLGRYSRDHLSCQQSL